MMQIILVSAPPQQQKGTINLVMDLLNVVMNIEVSRINPYPPNFRRIAAKIIDPATGASTCALGSHKCKPKIGTLTRNANKQNITITLLLVNFVLSWKRGIDK